MGRVRQLDDDERRPHPVGATPRLLGQARFGKRSPDERYPGSPSAVVIPHVAALMRGTEGYALRRPAPQAGPRTVVGLFPQYLQLLPNCARRSERPEVPQPDSCTAANTSLVYSITSSARARSVGGTSRPSALAVSKLPMRSNSQTRPRVSPSVACRSPRVPSS